MGALRLFFVLRSVILNKKMRFLVHAGVIGALYVVLTHLQNMVFPASTTMAIQFRASEALCVLALFTPAAIPGLAVGCLLFNLTSGAALPFDFLVGSLASLLAAAFMWWGRKYTVGGFPLVAMTMPALFNSILVGAELTLTQGIGGAFWWNALLVAIGEIGVLFTLGTALYYTLRKGLANRLFD